MAGRSWNVRSKLAQSSDRMLGVDHLLVRAAAGAAVAEGGDGMSLYERIAEIGIGICMVGFVALIIWSLL